MKNFENDIEQSLRVLEKSGLILYPTDTVWGIGCDATNKDAVQKIYRLKQRSDSKAMIVLLADEKSILQHVATVDLKLFDYLNETTKPTTVVYDAAIGFADNLIAEDGSIAIRICKDDFCRHLLKRFKKPIVSTSANFSGKPTPANFLAIDAEIKNAVDYVVHHRQNDLEIGKASSIIRWEKENPVFIRL